MRLLPAVLVLLAAPALHAQAVSIYGTFSPTHVSNLANGSSNTTSFWTPNVGGGVTLNVLPVGPVRLGFDLRGSTRRGTNGSDTGLVGLRLGVRAPLVRLKPYVQVSGGYLATRTAAANLPAGVFNRSYAAYELLGGVDLPFAPFFDLRLLELGGGQGRSTDGGNNVTLFTVSTGIVFHF